MAGLFIGVDVGTQGAKAVVYDSRSKAVVSRGAYKYDVIKTNVPGRAEQHPSLWIEGGFAAIQSALSEVDRKDVKGIGISGQQHGFVPMDGEGQVIRNAKLWCDVESADEAKQLSDLWEWTLVPGFTASKILWLKNKEPDNFARLRQVLLPHDFFNYHLTGRYVMEAGDASGTGLFDTANRKFDEARMRSIDQSLPEFFPELIGPNEVVGHLRPEIAAELGLTEDVAVAPGSGDNQMSALGAGAVKEGDWVVSLGTSGMLCHHEPIPVLDASGGIAPFCDSTGQFMPLLCTMNCTLAPEESFGLDHETITRLAEEEEAGSEGVNFLPFLTGERTPNWPHSYGVLTGLRPGGMRPGLLYRAALEGATFSLLNGVRFALAEKMQRLPLIQLRVVGGGSKNRLWRRIIADAFQLPLRFPAEPESAALGGALQAAAVCAGVPVADYVAENEPPCEAETLQPDPSKKLAYDDAFDRHQRLSNALFEK
ncbi:Xylulokinase [Coccomyxa subellipsoidea C-169]|uniref:Xylulokinase n=1 Tax=Coccomyxa subellipsoidea (strain C-169) TaxID=574566 RepID=I0YQU7_COCSC|nr:Xylulokinase [Coccomyxa subellipsoidea C-169]EIE20766.1 Xylulokinase [Coccomyxa subellipsoidea C-169]|eukprot:XP_005645310.1 Xylulokinase [Coccomyxa subellipsoidea C-169]